MIPCRVKKQSGFLVKFPLFLAFLCIALSASGQDVDCSISSNCSDPYCNYPADTEKGCNCFDNVDNDGDGAIDQADTNCATYYGMEFVGESSECFLIPPGSNTPFDLVGPPAVSGQNTSDTQSKVAVGDVDGDGIPDAVITSKWNRAIRVIATSDGQADGSNAGDTKSEFRIPGTDILPDPDSKYLVEHEILIADIDGNGTGEIYAVASYRGGGTVKTPPTRFYLLGFTYTAGTLTPLFNGVDVGPNRPGIPGVADMDGDGNGEIYLRDRIYAAESGKLLATGNGNWDLDITAGSVAVNISGDSKMELVCGTKIYSIPSLSNRNPATPAVLTVLHDMNAISANKCYVKLMLDPVEYGEDTHSSCSVADVDRDGVVDVVMTGALNATNGPTAVFYWNVAKNTVSYYLPPDPTYANGWPWGTSRINLGDANGDGATDFSFIAGNQLFCLTTDAGGNLVPLWASPRTVNDTRSGIVAVSIYDFNNDGNPEMVYRDSQELAVIDGETGTTKYWSAVCQSHTYTEGPVIADVNGDGATDICVACNTNNAFNINGDIQQQALGEVRLFFSNGNEWLPTRKVWNQPGYFVVNIKDDLTLPFPQFDQNFVFGTADCPNGLPGPQMPMNVFMNQVPFLSAEGCPIFPAPDLSFEGDDPDGGVDNDGDGVYSPAVEVVPPTCGDIDISARFNIINDGDLPITGDIPVSFFVGDPTEPTITSDSLIYNTTITLNNLQVGESYTSPWVNFNGPGTAFRLYIVLNNDGSVLPIQDSGSSTTECRIDNNIYSVWIEPDPFTTTIEKIQDNFKCDDTAADNGELRVRIFKDGVEVTDYSQYAFQWYTGTTASYTPIDGATNYNITGLAEGDYTAIVTNTAKGCTGTPVDTTVVRLGVDPDVTINVLSHQTVCDPPNGQLEAVIAGGNTGFTFEWFDIALNPLGISGPIASNLVAGNYLVRVSKDGCSENSLPQTVDGPVVPDAQAATLQNVVDCLNPNTGSITATALFNGAAQDPANYSFDWYFYDNATATRGSILPAAHGSGETRTGLPVGHYQVVVTDLLTQCAAIQAPVTAITSQTVIPTAVITELAPQTSCDPATPNGKLQGAVNIGGVIQDPSGYTFEWFKGDNTLPENAHTNVSGVNGSVAEEVSGGGVFYTLRVTTSNNCSDTEKFIITEDLNVPVITLSTTDNGICDPALATSTYNGTVTASVTFDGVAVADFTNYAITWHSGSLTTDPVIAGETAPLLDERNGGFYTVVIERTDLSCTSAPVTAEVINATTLPTISTDSIPSTNCAGGTPNGGVVVTGVVPADTYSYRWFDPSGALMAGETASSISGYQGGAGQNYTVEVTLASTGCRNTIATAIPEASVLPILSLTPSDNSICDGTLGFNGAITSSFTDTNALAGHGYTYVWSTGNDLSNPIAGQSGSSLTQRNGGFYTATITNTTLNCTSSPVTTEILNNQVLPAISATPTPSTNCPGGADNGAITASVTNGLAGQTFSFQWSKGNLVTDPDVAVADGGNTATIINQQGNQNYIVLVRNDQTGCENTFIQTLADNSVVPVLTLDSLDNSICDAALTYNGSAFQQAITGANESGTDTYTFAWSTGSDMSAVIGGETTNTLDQINGGFYTATATNDRLNCTSNPVTIQVRNLTILPAISAVAVPSTNCPGGTPNGEITASVTNNTSGATMAFQWYAGNIVDIAQAIPAAPNQGNTDNVIALQGGQNYLVHVRNQSTGCENTFIQALADNSMAPVLALDSLDNSICDASLNYNGSAFQQSVSGTNELLTDTYTFVWSNGSDMSNVIAGESTSTLDQINGGFYTATATNDRLNCSSNPVTIQVINNLILPAIAAVPSPSTNCAGGTPNGEIAASVTNNTSGATMAFQWYAGNIVDAGQAIAIVPNQGNTDNVIQLEGGQNYLVHVRNQSTGCENTFIQALADNSMAPVLALDSLDNSICDASLNYNGSAFQQSVSGTNELLTDTYTFVWSNGSDMSNVIVGESTSTLDQINGGFYTATATNDRLNCTSNPVTIQVINNLILPAIAAVPSPSTNCAGGTPNGEIAASVTNNTSGATMAFQWYAGNIVDAAQAIAAAPNQGNTDNVILIQGGQNYLVHVRNQSTGCENTFIQTLMDNSVVPVLALDSIDNSICDATLNYNGSALQETITGVNELGTDTYTFAWSTGSDMTAVLVGETTNTLDQINGGFYTATATNDRLNCTSNPVTIQVINNLTLPDIAAVPSASTNCAPGTPNGAISVSVTNNTAGHTFAYQWYDGNTATAGNEIPNSPNQGNTADAIQLQGGSNFTVHVRNDQTGCVTDFTQTLGDISELPAFSLTVANNEKCVAPYDGSLTITGLIDNNSLATDTYDVTWYDANVAGGPVSQSNLNVAQASLGASSARIERDNGFYTVVITNNRLGCTSSPVTSEVLDALEIPAITTLTAPSTNCVGGTANGEAEVTGILPADTYEYRWYSGSIVGAAGSEVNDDINDVDIAGLQGGAGADYTVEVTRTTTGCAGTATVTIVDNSQIPVVGALDHTDNENCTAPFNGTATVPVNGITYHGVAVNDPYTGFTLNFDGANADNIAARGTGTYSFRITHVSDNCVSDPVSVTILDNFTYPAIDVAQVDQTSCDAGNPNGRLTATVGGGTLGYVFNWYEGTGTGGTDITDATTPNVVAGLDSDNYTSLVTNATTRCASTVTVFLPDNIVNPAISLTNVVNVTRCDNPDGTSTPIVTNVSSLPGPDFTIYYVNTFSIPSQPASAPSDPAVIKASGTTYSSTAAVVDGFNPPPVGNLSPGYLTALIVDNNTTCESSPVTVQIQDVTNLNEINVGAIAAAGLCGGGGGGSIDVTVSGGTGPGTYTFAWYAGTPSNSNINFFNNPPDMTAVMPQIANTEDLLEDLAFPPAGVDAGTYTLVVVDGVGCGNYSISNVPFADRPDIAITPTHPERCSAPFDGELEVVLTNANFGPYSIVFYDGNSPDPSNIIRGEICDDLVDNDGDGLVDFLDPDCGSLTLDASMLTSGQYLVRVIDYVPANRACPLDQGVTLNQEGFAPVVQIDNIAPNTACDDLTNADGAVRITVSQDAADQRDPVATPIAFEVSSVSPAPVNPPAFPDALSTGVSTVTADLNYGFGPDTYMLRITETASGCFTDQSVIIPDQPEVPQLLQVDVTSETYCAPSSNGQALVAAVDPVAIDDYVYTWYSDPALTTVLYSANGDLAGGGELFDESKPGYATGVAGQGYGNQTVYVRGERLPGTGPGVGCPTPAVTVFIEDEHATPVSTLTLMPNTSCDPLVGEGSVSITSETVSPDVGVQNSLYTYTLNPDPNTMGAVAGNTGTIPYIFDRLLDAGYTVTTLNEQSGCVAQNGVTIQANKFPITITSHTFANQLICNPDGDIDVTGILIDRTITGQANLAFPPDGTISDNFDFEWFLAPAGASGTFDPNSPLTDPAAFGADVISTKLLTGNLTPANGEYENMGAGTYYVIATRKGGGAALAPVVGLGCETAPLRIDIQDEHANPVVTLTPFSDTSCTGPGEGSIEVDVTDGSVVAGPFTYTYSWTTTGLTPPVTSNPYDGVDNIFAPLDEGDYTNTVTNDMTGCTATATTTILKNVTPIFVTDINVVPQLYCDPSGRIEVTGIEFEDRNGNIVVPAIGDFEFDWTRSGIGAVGTTAPRLDSTALNYPAIGFGQYAVFATRTAGAPGFGCESAPINVTIDDKRIFPSISLTPFSNTSCTVAFEGEIQINITDASAPKVAPSPLAGNALTYTYDWTTVVTPILASAGNNGNGINDGDNDRASSLQEGQYVLQATSEITGCVSTASTTIIKNQTPVFLTVVNPTPQFYCDPSGRLEVTEVNYNDRDGNTVNGVMSDYTFTWARDLTTNTVATTLGSDPRGAFLDSLVYPGIGFDPDYYVVATRTNGAPGAGCSSAPIKVEITDMRAYPNVVLTPFSNTSCTTAFEGQIEIDITDRSASKVAPSPDAGQPVLYDYTWTDISGGLVLPPNDAGQTGVNNIYSNLEDGTYKLTALNTITGCSSEATTTIIKNQTPVFLTVVNATPQFYCDPSGRLEVTQVSYNDRDGNNINGILSDYTFAWARDLTTNTVATTLGSDPRGAFLDSLVYAGIGFDPDYYVVATRTNGAPGAGCSSAPIKVEITDMRAYPNVVLTPFSNTSCTTAFEGQIEIDITDRSASKVAPSTDAGQPVLYDYTWTDISGGLVLPPNDAGQTGVNNIYSNLEDGTYKLTALNTVTGCSSEATTTIIKNQTPVFLTVVNATPQFYCDPSGRLEVTQVSYNDRDGNNINGVLSDYTFAWARDLTTNTVATTLGSDPRGAFLDSLVYAGIGFDPDYYVVATRTNGAPGAGCSSAPIKVEITDMRTYPSIVLTPFSNTSCTTAFEGQIEIDITDASANKVAPSPDAGQPVLYDYTWTDISGGLALPPNDAGQTGVNNIYSSLQDGTYRLTAVNTVTGCSSEASTTIIKNQTPIFVQDVDMIPQLYCTPSGHVEVRSISYNDRNGVSQVGPLSDFTFAWTRNDLTTVAGNTDGSMPRGTFLDSLSYAGPGTIGFGSYYVVATRNTGVPGAGCQSAPFKMDITDERENPVVNFTTIANTACDNNFDGRITVLSSNAKAPGAGSNYDIQWISVPAGNTLADVNGVSASYTTPLTDVIGPGSFTVRVTNATTSCSSDAVVTMISNPQPVEILTVNKLDQMICFPDGSITVSAVSPAVVPDYNFAWYRNDAATPALVDGANTTIVSPTLDNTNYPTMGADTYFIVGQKLTALGSGCLTPPFRVNIEDRHVDPTASFTFAPNSSCDPADPNGQIIATASERDGTTDNYTFGWTLNGAVLPVVTTQTDVSPNSQLDNAYEGQYVLIATNTVTGCDVTGGIAVNLDHNISLPNIITVDTFDPLDCLASGQAEVTAISIGGGPSITGPVLGTDFQYEWYQDDFVPANQMANSAPLNAALNAGRYFVRVQDLTTDCKSSPTEVVILEDNIVYPAVTIDQTALQVRCVVDQGTAELIARGDGNTDAHPDYQFSWFNNLETTGPAFSSTSTISDLMHGEYSVLVTNNATGCSASEIYVVRDDSDRYLPALSLNTEARIDCVNPDGALLAREVGYDPNDLGYPYPSANYSAEWYAGANANVSVAGTAMNNLAGFNRNWREAGLDVGDYTVKITDNNTGCITTGTTTVADGRVLPVVIIVEDNPLINCDPARPNGQLSATADGGKVGGYLFDWYNGTTASGVVLTTNNKLIGIGMGDYTVRVTNDFTNCAADATASMTDGRLTPPTPTAELVFDRTRCDYPDGWVTAHVGGVTFNYSFDWYDGSALKTSPDFTGINYKDRDIGFYTVTAMDEVTGCISLPTSVEVKDLRVIPEVIIHTTPSFCEELPGSIGGNGTAEIELKPSNVVTDDVTWTLESETATVGIGSYITNILPGFYQANVVTAQGCVAAGVGEVATEIFSYNLVSNNGDSKNENFRIDCISQFPNNNVKIFNRAGILVYQADGYNNDDIVFRGFGEKGLYTIGNELPIGTYFYVIDKRDGSKPKTGYLELVR